MSSREDVAEKMLPTLFLNLSFYVPCFLAEKVMLEIFELSVAESLSLCLSGIFFFEYNAIFEGLYQL